MAKVMISVPDDLLEQIDRKAKDRGQTRSALLQEAASKELKLPTRREFDTALEELRTIFSDLPDRDLWSDIKAGREERSAKGSS